MNFSRYKERFTGILSIIDTQECKQAINLIQELPDEEKDGFHRNYLISNLISIVLKHIKIKEFQEFSNFVKEAIFVALFILDIEESVAKSVHNTILCYEKKKEAYIKQGKTLLSMLDDLFKNEKDSISENFLEPKDLFKDLQELENACNSFIEFYEKNDRLLPLISQVLSSQFSIRKCRVSGEEIKKHESLFLPDTRPKYVQPNNRILIVGMGPCLGLIIVGFNQKNKPLARVWHIDSSVYINFISDLYNTFLMLVEDLKSKGYSENLSLFLTGGDMMSFPLILGLTKCFIQPPYPKLTISSYMLPLVQAESSHCLLELTDKISITVATQFFNGDDCVQEHYGVDLLLEEPQSTEDSNEQNKKNIYNNSNIQSNTDFFSNSSSEGKIKETENLMKKN